MDKPLALNFLVFVVLFLWCPSSYCKFYKLRHDVGQTDSRGPVYATRDITGSTTEIVALEIVRERKMDCI